MPTEGERFTSNLAVTLTAEPIFGSALSLAQSCVFLGRMSLESVVGRLVLLKHINESVLSDPDVTQDQRRNHTLRILEFLFDPPGVMAALADAREDPNFRPVSDQALLAVLELAVRCCPRDGLHWINSDAQRMELAHVLLSFQSALFSKSLHERVSRAGSFEALGPDGLAEFVRNTMAHNTSRYYRTALGRLYAMCCVPEVTDIVLARTGKSAHDWFVESFGLTPADYLRCAFLSGGPSFRLNVDAPDAGALFYREDTFWNAILEVERIKLRHFLRLATQAIGESTGAPHGSIDEFLYSASSFYVRPVLDLGHVSVCVSPDLMMTKFIFGLPYLAQEARTRTLGRPLNESERKACRAPFGVLFESYVAWLLRKVIGPIGQVEILTGVTYGPRKNPVECGDVVVLRGDYAIVLEVKTTMALLRFRQTGRFEDLDAMLKTGAKQVYKAAHAIRDGGAIRSNGSPIEGVRFVVPCVATYDDIPLFEPISVFYERHLAAEIGLPIFCSADGVEAVQIFDIDFIESWETCFDLSPGSGAVFGYLIQRARREELRYRRVRAGIVRPMSAGAPQPFNEIVEQSMAFVDSTRAWLRPAVS